MRLPVIAAITPLYLSKFINFQAVSWHTIMFQLIAMQCVRREQKRWDGCCILVSITIILLINYSMDLQTSDIPLHE